MKGLTSYPNPLLRGRRFGLGVPVGRINFRLWRMLMRVTVGPIWRVRVFNRKVEPASGSGLYICNHQSFLDPIFMSFALKRPMNYMARDTLFKVPGFGALIHSVNAFPVKRGTADTGALKEALRRLKQGHNLAVFAEGTRTRDGRIGPFLPGVSMLAQRAADWIVPVVIDGAYECWPRTQLLPSPGLVTVGYCEPISHDDARKMDGQEFLDSIRQSMIQLQATLRRQTGRGELIY